ncbi:Aminotransferase class-III [Lysobacter dokdonensis DS-58]|uniref:Aminotransferase class-III n=1 Tax=Lysobacter dokdonensis DS-58 TaxID=1300345 RepID=A0A0A2WJW6_9GAMM|nr:aminotransferase class III-fold pyridoxal phosphate-dependent enzyme [Lysobacter dokdonensis]KGQ20088.1 Aminotransferase class-III [Lysobacter dokdonensis DS-58]
MSIDERQSVLHSWSVQADWRAPTVVGGAGAWLRLSDGRRVLDMSSLAECSNLGHQHPKLVEAIRAQAQRLCYVSNAWGAEPRARLADMLLERSGFEGGRVFFTLGGADANENAVKIARQASRKPRGTIIARDRSYHGATHLAMALSGDSRTQAQVDAQGMGVSHVPPPYAYRCPFDSADADDCGRRGADAVARRIDEIGVDRVAAVLMEPNAGTNGIVAPDSYWPALRRATAQRAVYLIADEVMSAFGRCGEWFAWQRHRDTCPPDMMTLAKGLTGAAVPLGAVVLSHAIASRLEHEMLYTGLTYCGHPLACAAGVAALEAYADENLIERSRTLGAQLLAQAKRLQQRHEVIGDVRGGHGLFVVIELVADRDTRAPLASWPHTPPALKALVHEAMAEGVSFATRGNLILLAPPLVIEEDALDHALTLLDRLLERHFASTPVEVHP